MKNLVIFILLLALFNSNLKADDAQLPDSIISIEHTYYYIVTEPEKAQKIMDELKKRKKDKEWELEWCQGDLYYNTGKYRLATYYFERVAKYDEVKNKPQLLMGLLSTMMECYRMNNDMEKAMQAAINVVDLAKKMEDKAEIGRAYQFMGIITFRQNDEKLAENYFSLAVKNLKEASNAEYLYHLNLSIADLMAEFKEYDKAYGYIKDAESNLKQMEKNEADLLTPEGQIAYEQGRLYALASEVAVKAGNGREAVDYYQKFMISPCATDSRSKIFIVPYLLDVKEYQKALSISQERIESLRAETDTIGENMAAALNYIIQAYELEGDKDKALTYSKQSLSLNDKIRNKDRESAALELSIIYDVQEKEAHITDQGNALQRQNIFLIASVLIIILSVISIVLIIQNMKRIKNKNIAMVRQIKEMQIYQEKIEQLQDQKQKSSPLNEPENTERDEKLTISEIFTMADQKIRNEKLYLNSDITRDDVIGILDVKRADFIQAVKEATGMSFTDYVNGIRMEEAIRLLDKDISMNLVAERSGFGSTRTFYRQFHDRYKMSPSEYKKLVKQE